MTGPQGMGCLVPSLIDQQPFSQYDNDLVTTGAIFMIRPESNLPTYNAWESNFEALFDHIANESAQGILYMRAWAYESGEMYTYEEQVELAWFGSLFRIAPENSMPTYTSWESRGGAYSGNIASESAQGRIYFRAWAYESGGLGTYEDHIDDTQLGTIFKVEDDVV